MKNQINKETYEALKIIVKEFDNDLGGRGKEFESALKKIKMLIKKNFEQYDK